MVLTAFAMWMRSCRTAIISARLYFRTGVCPVANEWDFAHPSPKRRLRLPVRAAVVLRARVLGHVQPWNLDGTRRPRDFHQAGCSTHGRLLAAPP